MMAVRERAVAVMAALDRRVPSLDDFVGQSWSAWADRASVTAADGPDGDDCSRNGKKAAEAMYLSKEDMSIFGLYPGHDDFYLVVCSHCGQVVKPQAFEKHCERRHGPLAKLYGKLRSPAPVPQHQKPYHGLSPSHGVNPPCASSWEARAPPRAPPSPSPSTPPQYRHPKSSKDGVRHSPLEKAFHSGVKEAAVFKPPPPPLEPPVLSPPPSLRDPPWPHGGSAGARPAPVDKPPGQRKESPHPPPAMAHRVPRPYNKVASKRECDLDKHCGVLDPDRKKVCTRLLTCNIHSIHQRRKVAGRSKNFDQLVAELKMKVREKGAQALDGGFSTGGSPSPEAPREQAGVPHCRRPLASLPAFSRSVAVSEVTPEEEKQWQDEAGLRAPSPLVHGHISSDDSEAEGPEELSDFPSSTAHPRPAAVCSFGSRSLGQGIFTFDRRLHHVRSALSSMLEQHISAHLWKKIPQAADLLLPASSSRPLSSSSPVSMVTSSSSSSSSSPFHSKVRAGSHISSSLKAAASSPSRGPGRPPSENSGTARPSSLGRPGGGGGARPPGPRNPVGRPSKQMLRLREEAASAAAFRKRKAPSQEGERSGPERNCVVPQDRGLPSSSSSSSSPKAPAASLLPHGQTNGTLSPSLKPRPQPPCSEAVWTYRRTHSSAPDPPSGLHGGGRTLLDPQGLKRRNPPSSRLSVQRLPSSSSSSGSASSSSSPRSTFYPWKDSKAGALDGDLEKKLAAQKPKLHH